MRVAGVLLGVASLPSKYGIGDLGSEAYEFVDIMANMNVKVWQVLPLNPLGFGNSPYQPYSSFAGDELYISLERLVSDGLLAADELKSFNASKTTIDYIQVREFKAQLLAKAFANYQTKQQLQDECKQFVANTSWVYNYAVFLTLKKANNLRQWNEWPAEQKNWIKDHKLDLTPFQNQIAYELFIQFIFYRQWMALKAYANSKNIQIMGDIPIYLGYDSADVWENQESFLLDENQNPTFIAGVPPDYFSATGQRWGNPIYDWEKLEQTGFKFWIDRLRGNADAFDIIRIDHFRAFDTYWKIPASCPTAVDGEWVEAPGYALFDAIYKAMPDVKIVVEDLGDLRPEVHQLRDHYKLPGMQIFQFKYELNGDNSVMAETKNTIVYTGTHDNETLMGWYLGLSRYQRKQLKRELKATENNIKNKILNLILGYQANYVVFPVQDLIGLDNHARINFPGKIGSPNWEWKLASFDELSRLVPWFAQQAVKAKR